MRLLIKLGVAIALAVALQSAIGAAPGGMVDEWQFALRVRIATAYGKPIESPELLDAADRLWTRQTGWQRNRSWPHVTAPHAEADCDQEGTSLVAADLDSPPGHF